MALGKFLGWASQSACLQLPVGTLPAVSLGRDFIPTTQSPLLLSVFRGARPVLAQVSTVTAAPSWSEI